MDIVAGDLFIDSDVKQKLRRCLEDILNGNCPLYPVLRAIFGNNLRMLERLMGHTFVNVKHLDGLSATAQFPETGSKVFENIFILAKSYTVGHRFSTPNVLVEQIQVKTLAQNHVCVFRDRAHTQ